MEEIELDPFLIQCHCERLVIKVGQGMVVRQTTIGAGTTCWLVWDRLVPSLEETVVVAVCDWVGRSGRNGLGDRRSTQSASHGRRAGVRSMRGCTGHFRAANRRDRAAQRSKGDLRGGSYKSSKAQQKASIRLHGACLLVDEEGNSRDQVHGGIFDGIFIGRNTRREFISDLLTPRSMTS